MPPPVFDRAQATPKHLDNLVSMSDGQIWLGNCVLIDMYKSLSRVGVGKDTNGRANAPVYRKLGGPRLRFDLVQMEQDFKRTEERTFMG